MTYNQLKIHLAKNIYNICYKHKLKKIIIAISGGQDSILLIKLFLSIHLKTQILDKVNFIYVDHQWRSDSYKQIKHLINYLTTYDQSLSIYQITQSDSILNERDCRLARYNIIINHAIANKYQCIITAHTKTDVAETFLINLIRGTSIDGATNLTKHKQFHNQLHLLRPLIDFNRYHIKFLCNKLCLPIWSDSSNTDMNLMRNRIRYELFPYIKNYFNQNIEYNINKFLNICFLNNDYIKQNILKFYLISHHYKYIAINYQFIKKQHFILKTKIIQLFFLMHFNILLQSDEIQAIIDALKKSVSVIYYKLTIKVTKAWIYII